MSFKLCLFFIAVFLCTNIEVASRLAASFNKKQQQKNPCSNVCIDLPKDDLEPVCMMFSRYKRGYQYFINLCQARRAICYENLGFVIRSFCFLKCERQPWISCAGH